MSKLKKMGFNIKSDTFTDTVSIVFRIFAAVFAVLNYIMLIFTSKLDIHSTDFLVLSAASTVFIVLIVFFEPTTYKKNRIANFIINLLIAVCCGFIFASHKTLISMSIFFIGMVVVGLKLSIKQSVFLSFAYYIAFMFAMLFGSKSGIESILFDVQVLLIFLSTIYLCHYFSEIEYEKIKQDEAVVDLLGEKVSLTQRLSDRSEELEQTYWDMVETLIGVIEARDNFTGGHSIKVCEYSVKLARRSGLNEDKVSKIMQAAILHDIGKMGIPDDILLKPGALSNDEYATIMTHPEIGCRILSKVKGLEDILPMILYHHERVDGTGYPYGQEGDKIPYGARIIAIADAYDAMTSNRPYRRALIKKEAKKRLMENSGTQFDPELTALFLDIIENDNVERINEYRHIETIKKHTGIG